MIGYENKMLILWMFNTKLNFGSNALNEWRHMYIRNVYSSDFSAESLIEWKDSIEIENGLEADKEMFTIWDFVKLQLECSHTF